MARKFNMTSVGGKREGVRSTRQLNRMARARGFINAKQMYVQLMADQFRKMIAQQAQSPDVVGSLDVVKEAA